ncbi:MAG TPA: hypothetical protein DCP90_03895 [Clostridiales bacterium]|nr:MAG: hypothetical protein A2Y22_04040 [Clostridiales bacterium GWD2_32_59]HAN09738.1 hypothetical protein [Clostridiales bacterium]
MIIFSIMIIAIIIYEIINMEEKVTKDIALLIGISVFTWLAGFLYISDPYRDSIVKLIMDTLGIKM